MKISIFYFLFMTSVTFICFAADEENRLISSGPLSPPLTHWTQEMMQNAKPYPMAYPGGPSSGNPPVPEGPAGSGAAGQRTNILNNTFGEGSFDAIFQLTDEGYRYPFPFTRYENISKYDVWPYSAIVKIYFQANGRNFICSGAVWPNRAVLTAGHCVYDQGKFHTNFKIVPQYKNGKEPLGSFTATELYTTTQWQVSRNNSYDLGLIITDKNDGKGISYFTGWFGAAWNLSRKQSWTLVGYPAERPFDGKTQHICHASYADIDASTTPSTIAIGCDLTGGTSGSPFILGFSGKNVESANRINGLASYRFTSRNPKALYSPYFGNAAQNFWKKALQIK